MFRSMYAGVSGMKGFQTKLDVIGNNISNVNTVGYKKSSVNFQDLLSQNISGGGANSMQVGMGSSTGSINVNHNAGSSMTTGVGTDLAITGGGFFIVREPGTENDFLTRAGNFTVTEAGNLVTAQGYEVLDNNGDPIDLSGYESFSIGRTGVITGAGAEGAEVDDITIGVFAPANPAGLTKFGGSLYQVNARSGGDIEYSTAGDSNSQITSGTLEMSNVDLTEEFTEMIIAQRGFQANSRTVTTSDEILQEVVNLKR